MANIPSVLQPPANRILIACVVVVGIVAAFGGFEKRKDFRTAEYTVNDLATIEFNWGTVELKGVYDKSMPGALLDDPETSEQFMRMRVTNQQRQPTLPNEGVGALVLSNDADTLMPYDSSDDASELQKSLQGAREFGFAVSGAEVFNPGVPTDIEFPLEGVESIQINRLNWSDGRPGMSGGWGLGATIAEIKVS